MMQFSPKLKKAMSEIKEILEREDIAGVCVLHTEQHGGFFSEYLLQISPSQSCAFLENNMIRVKGKAGDKRILYTANMLKMLAETTAETSLTLFEISETVDAKSGAEHGDSQFTPDNYFDN